MAVNRCHDSHGISTRDGKGVKYSVLLSNKVPEFAGLSVGEFQDGQ